MNDDIEKLLSGLSPRGAATELRPRVLAAVADELQAVPPSPWLRPAALAVAASLLVGIALNVCVSQAVDRRLTELLGSLPVARQDAQRAVAEYNAILQQLIAESQGPATKPRPAVAPRGAVDGETDDHGSMLNGAPARPRVTDVC
jgi:hypothetical protein